MRHWTEKYIGRPYDRVNYNCGDLCLDVLRVEFGKTVDLPIARESYSWRELSEVIATEAPKQAALTDSPEEGDIVLMRNGERLKHVGILVNYKGRNCVLHNLNKVGVCMHAVSGLGSGLVAQLTVEGYYRVA